MNPKKQNFKRIADNRTNKIIELISKLHNLTNASFYEYEQEEVEEIFNKIQFELDKQKKEFEKVSEKKNKKVEL